MANPLREGSMQTSFLVVAAESLSVFILIYSLLYQSIHCPSTPPCLSSRPREKYTNRSLESSQDHSIRKLPAQPDSVSPK